MRVVDCREVHMRSEGKSMVIILIGLFVVMPICMMALQVMEAALKGCK